MSCARFWMSTLAAKDDPACDDFSWGALDGGGWVADSVALEDVRLDSFTAGGQGAPAHSAQRPTPNSFCTSSSSDDVKRMVHVGTRGVDGSVASVSPIASTPRISFVT
ncbi:hypothetical protein Dimus_034564 [Dionaea muscipula]